MKPTLPELKGQNKSNQHWDRIVSQFRPQFSDQLSAQLWWRLVQLHNQLKDKL